MPSINRIRVNNVKYNFGTQGYDDFSMRMYGRNTLYDLANGGGKSVLMLLLMQNLIPNCTLDDKQPIEKLFRDPSNTVIHSLIEWKLDECDIREGMRYMTTGFAARKATNSEGAEEVRENGTAQIEYFNYVIFYRDYNKNDIINLPLVKDNENISYKALRNYLHDLARSDKNMIVRVFDRKGEYQKFIADYGLYESHWEIIRGINKTEGHVRTYFESNYKTTRRVIEDLLIEEIIEKAYQTKTDRETDKTENTVSLLMTIQEELKNLAEKKKGIQLYDHEQELLQLLIDRLASFMELYTHQENTATEVGRILVTLEAEKKSREDRLNSLKENVISGEEKLRNAKEKVELLKVYEDIQELEKREGLIQEKELAIKKLSEEIEIQDRSNRHRMAVNYYLELKKAKEELEELSREKKDIPKGAEDIYTVVANIRELLDDAKKRLEERAVPIREKENKLQTELEKLNKERVEAETQIAVLSSRIEYLNKDYDDLNNELEKLQRNVDYALLMDPVNSVKQETKLFEESEKKVSSLQKGLESKGVERGQYQARIEELQAELLTTESDLRLLEGKAQEYRNNKDKLKSICSIYADDASASLEDVEKRLSDRLSETVINVYKQKQTLNTLERRENEIRDGKLIEESDGVKKVLDYLFTRHGISAMHGMDYLAALPEEQKKAVISSTSGIVYGIVVENLDELTSDPGLKELDIDEEIFLYDKEYLTDTNVLLGEGVEAIRRDKEYFLEPRFLDQKLRLVGADRDNKQEELRSSELVLETLGEDLDFVKMFRDHGLEKAEENLKKSQEQRKASEEELSKNQEKLRSLESRISEEELLLQDEEVKVNRLHAELISLHNIVSQQDRINKLSKAKEELKQNKRNLQKSVDDLNVKMRATELKLLEAKSELEALDSEKLEMEHRWDNKYSIYYMEGTEFPHLEMDESGLEHAFERALGNMSDSPMALEKEKLLTDTLNSTIERESKAIGSLGIDIDELIEMDKNETLVQVRDDVLNAVREELEKLKNERTRLDKEISDISTEKARLEGSITYAKERLSGEFGPESVEKIELLNGEDDNLADAKSRCSLCKSELDRAKKELEKAEGFARGGEDLIRFATRIVETNAIDVESLEALSYTDDLRNTFDDLITKYDKLSKDIDRAKSDLMKVKMNVYDTLSALGVTELAMSIRDDVIIPENKRSAEQLLKRLGDVVEIIGLERDRVEKSLVSMQQLKDSFVDQCIERCLDVRSELDKLTKLSEITMGNDKVQMIKLSIPYVKDEFIKDRMSEYIDWVVEEVDKKENESERQKFLGTSLAMKKLFSVIVTDMSKIKLLLYKRERIKEQSRYLRYEEAVGSTGQSQGIYIQFLISIINYIAGMYAVADSTTRSKTLFIDNPFGAAKDIYIWEPIFSLLEENSCQLIVPARGATPEITGRFDINYVLGQQMTGNRTTTVVVNYSSKTKGEELEYKDLDYEQQTFDFI